MTVLTRAFGRNDGVARKDHTAGILPDCLGREGSDLQVGSKSACSSLARLLQGIRYGGFPKLLLGRRGALPPAAGVVLDQPEALIQLAFILPDFLLELNKAGIPVVAQAQLAVQFASFAGRLALELGHFFRKGYFFSLDLGP